MQRNSPQDISLYGKYSDSPRSLTQTWSQLQPNIFLRSEIVDCPASATIEMVCKGMALLMFLFNLRKYFANMTVRVHWPNRTVSCSRRIQIAEKQSSHVSQSTQKLRAGPFWNLWEHPLLALSSLCVRQKISFYKTEAIDPPSEPWLCQQPWFWLQGQRQRWWQFTQHGGHWPLGQLTTRRGQPGGVPCQETEASGTWCKTKGHAECSRRCNKYGSSNYEG